MLHHYRGRVAHFEGDLPGVLYHLHPVGAEGVPQSVPLVFHARRLASTRQRPPEITIRDCTAAPIAIGREPLQQILGQINLPLPARFRD